MLIIFISLLLIGTLFYFISNNKTQQIKENITFTFNEAISSLDGKNCKYINDSQKQLNCESALDYCSTDECNVLSALRTHELKYCDQIKNQEKKTNCNFKITTLSVYQEVKNKKDISLCNNFENEIEILICKEKTLLMMAIDYNDKSYCEQIQSEVLKNDCINLK